MATTPLQAIRYQASTDPPNGATLGQNLANDLEKKSVMVFASSAARTAAFTAASVTPTEGMLCWLQDVNRYENVDGAGAWVALVGASASWASYTPAWTSSGTAPSIGNGTLSGRYYRPTGASIVTVVGRLLLGSTSNPGTGFYFVSLPFAVNAASQLLVAGSAAVRNTGVQDWVANCIVNPSNASQILFVTDGNNVANTVPYTFASGGQLIWSLTYEI